MTEPRFTVADLVAERSDMQPTGERYIELPMTGTTIATLSPHARRTVAAFLTALLNRAPLKDGAEYNAHREILGSLVLELEAAAIVDALDDAPRLAAADLRDPATSDRERELIRQTRDWAAAEQQRRGELAHARLDDMLAITAEEHERADRRLQEAADRAQAIVATPAPPEPDDASAWLA